MPGCSAGLQPGICAALKGSGTVESADRRYQGGIGNVTPAYDYWTSPLHKLDTATGIHNTQWEQDDC